MVDRLVSGSDDLESEVERYFLISYLLNTGAIGELLLVVRGFLRRSDLVDYLGCDANDLAVTCIYEFACKEDFDRYNS